MRFCVVFLKNKKKLDKWFKKNLISNKVVVDIRDLLEDSELNPADINTNAFKIIVWRQIEKALEKGHDIYYIPYIEHPDFSIDKIQKIKTILPDIWRFESLVFFDDIIKSNYATRLTTDIDIFDAMKIVEC